MSFLLYFGRIMKKYLLLIEDEGLWEKFKKENSKDINTEIMNLIKNKVKRKGGKDGRDEE